MIQIVSLVDNNEAEIIAKKLNTEVLHEIKADENLKLVFGNDGVSLRAGKLCLLPDFSHLSERIKKGRLTQEVLWKASRLKNHEGRLRGFDATAGLGEDSLILAAAGYEMDLYEYNPVIAALLKDAVKRALDDPKLSEAAGRMHVYEGDSIEAMRTANQEYELILLDPMFPKREKSGLIKKKFQLLQQLECPCGNEEELLQAALKLRPERLLIKRPQKGPYLGGKKPDFSYDGKAVRYDCFTFPKSKTP